jgi:hypothetical protein
MGCQDRTAQVELLIDKFATKVEGEAYEPGRCSDDNHAVGIVDVSGFRATAGRPRCPPLPGFFPVQT